ncbi:MAG: hypothetical protein RIS47_1346, partial [Bacteroidota bacterium]
GLRFEFVRGLLHGHRPTERVGLAYLRRRIEKLPHGLARIAAVAAALNIVSFPLQILFLFFFRFLALLFVNWL